MRLEYALVPINMTYPLILFTTKLDSTGPLTLKGINTNAVPFQGRIFVCGLCGHYASVFFSAMQMS